MIAKLIYSTLLLICLPLWANEIDRQLKIEREGDSYFQISSDELIQAKQAFKQSLDCNNTDDIWQSLAMTMHNTDNGLMLTEAAHAQYGRGLFMVSQSEPEQPWLIQAPHADTDLYTGEIASKLYLEGDFKAGQWNTRSRKIAITQRVGKADQAHLNHSYWQALTQAFAESYPNGKIIQLHGFSQSKRKTKAARTLDLILSSGSRKPPQWLQKAALCLEQSLDINVGLYPYDVKELGGTKNTQGRLLRNMGHHGFLHLEMSKPLRKQLLKQKIVRQKLLGCLSE